MLDPQAECPECGGKLGRHPDCRNCGWKPGPVRAFAAHDWTAPKFTPPTPEEHEAILRLIAETSAKLGAAKVERPTKRYQATQRCPACDMGKFVHGGVRYCAACYGRL